MWTIPLLTFIDLPILKTNKNNLNYFKNIYLRVQVICCDCDAFTDWIWPGSDFIPIVCCITSFSNSLVNVFGLRRLFKEIQFVFLLKHSCTIVPIRYNLTSAGTEAPEQRRICTTRPSTETSSGSIGWSNTDPLRRGFQSQEEHQIQRQMSVSGFI